MPSFDSSVAVVLAAGRGRRMGANKALMDVDGAPWWKRQLGRLNGIGARSVWALSPEVAEAIEAEPDAPLAIVRCSADAPMFQSLARVVVSLSRNSPERVFVLPIDCPVPSKEVWEALLDAGPVAAPEHAGVSGHPLALKWDWIAAHILPRAHDQTNDLRLDVLTRADRRLVPVSDPSCRFNLNRPSDIAAWSKTVS